MDDPSSGLEDALRLARSPLPAALVAAWAGVGLAAAPFIARNRTRLRTALRISATVVVVGGATTWLVARSLERRAEYYKYVDEVTARPSVWRDKNLQVHGCVAEGSFERAVGAPSRYRFVLRPSGRFDRPPPVATPQDTLRVTYEGELPPTSGEGRDVVVKGRLIAGDVLAAVPDGLMFKCPSKYDPSVLGPRISRCPP